MKRRLGHLWGAWKEIAGYIGEFQSRLLLTVFYFTVMAPFAIVTRLFSDPLRLRRAPADTGWTKREQRSAESESVRRQF